MDYSSARILAAVYNAIRAGMGDTGADLADDVLLQFASDPNTSAHEANILRILASRAHPLPERERPDLRVAAGGAA